MKYPKDKKRSKDIEAGAFLPFPPIPSYHYPRRDMPRLSARRGSEAYPVPGKYPGHTPDERMTMEEWFEAWYGVPLEVRREQMQNLGNLPGSRSPVSRPPQPVPLPTPGSPFGLSAPKAPAGADKSLEERERERLARKRKEDLERLRKKGRK